MTADTLIDVSDPFRAERAAEIRRISSRHTALLNDLRETQIEQSRQLGSLGTDLGSLGTTIDKGLPTSTQGSRG
jgi:hypothetical protein